MRIKTSLKNMVFIFLSVILLVPVQFTYADSGATTVNVPNNQGGYTAIVIKQSGSGYVGPQGEFYPQFPTVSQLQVVYGTGTSNTTGYVSNSAAQSKTIDTPPPAIPVYEQPSPPDPSDAWTPGYWAYNYYWQDYYWVPGTWFAAPYPGYLWTPGYWHWRGGNYFFSNGYWGPHVGFYGGINYGFGYGGIGFSATWSSGGGWNNGGWHNGSFNSENTNTNSNNISNTSNSSTASFNGGPGGVKAMPTPQEQAAMKEKHVPPTAEQKMHLRAARKNPALRASMNHGKPAIAATSKPGVFKGKGVVAAKQAGAEYHKTDASAKRAAALHRRAGQHAKARTRPKPRTRPKVNPKKKIPPANGQNFN